MVSSGDWRLSFRMRVNVIDELQILTDLSKGLVDNLGHLKVKLGIDIAHERFIVFELAGHYCEMSQYSSQYFVPHLYLKENKHTLRFSLVSLRRRHKEHWSPDNGGKRADDQNTCFSACDSCDMLD